MKAKAMLLTLTMVTALAVGCTQQPAPAPAAPAPAPAPVETPAPEAPEVVTTASIVNEAAAFEKAISKDGTWIIATLGDLTVDKELVMEGEFHDKNDAAKDLKRKVALYTQDDKRNVTARFTLTAPKLTILSPNATIQHGTFKGDIYVSAPGFNLVDNVVEGNIYFTTEEAQSTFKMDETSKVTGVQELKK